MKRPVGVLVSGAGTNLAAILDACREPSYPGRVVVIVSDRAPAGAFDRAKAAGVPAEHVPIGRGADQVARDTAHLTGALRGHGVEIVCLAGYMRVLPDLPAAFGGRVLNIHPSLLPAFPGLDAVGQALAHGAKVTGVTVHLVDTEVDHGPIVVQEAVEVRTGDTPATLHARLQEVEHRLYPLALRLLAEDRLRVEGRTVRVLPGSGT